MEELESPLNGKLANPLHGEKITQLQAAQLGPDGITVYEPAIRDAISRTLPVQGPESTRKIERVQNAVILQLRTTELQCWMLGTPIDGRVHMCGFIFTQVVKEPFSGDRNLNLLTLSMFYPFEAAALHGMMPALETYARNSGCSGMVTTVDVENRRAIMAAQELGFEAVTFSGYRSISS